jgi:site-specific recombinase XerD
MRSSPPPPPTEAGGRVEAFLRSRSAGSPATVDTYRRRLAGYVSWNGGPEVDRDRYDRYMDHVRRQGRRPNGLALESNVLRLFAEFCGVPTVGWQRARWREVPISWLKPTEVDAMRDALLASRHDGPDRAFVLDLLVGTGLRLGELAALRWRDVDLEQDLILVRSGKGSKSRTIPLPGDGPPVVRRALQSLIEAFWRHYPNRSLDETRLVKEGVCPFQRWQVQNFLRSAAKRAGLSAMTIYPHLLRHTYATTLTMAGVPAPVVQRLLGHASLGTTSRYTRATGADAADALRRAGGSDVK